MAKKTLIQKPNSPWKMWLLPCSIVLISLLKFDTLLDPVSLPRQMIWAAALIVSLFALNSISKEKSPGFLAGVPRILLISGAGLLAAHIISLTVAHNLAEGIHSTVRMGLTLLSILIVAAQIRIGGIKAGKAWAISIWGAGTLQVVVGLFQMFSSSDANGNSVLPTGTMVNSNLLGTFIAISLPFAVWMIFKGPSFLRIAAGISALMALFVIYQSQSRTALLILLIFAGLLVPFGIRAAGKTARLTQLSKWIPVLTVLLVVIAWFALYKGWGRKEMPRSYDYIFNDESAITREMSSIEVRMVLWNKSIQMGMGHPLTGVGAGNWKIIIPSFGVQGYDSKDRYGMVTWIRPHNDYLWIFAETGVPGLLSYVSILVILMGMAIRRIWTGLEVESVFILHAAMFGLAGYMVDALFSFPGERIESMICLAAFAGLILNSGKPFETGGIQKTNSKVLFYSFAGFLTITFLLSAFRVPMDAAAKKMRDAKEMKNYSEVAVQAAKAESWLNPLDAASGVPLAWYKAMALVEQGRAMGNSSNQVQYFNQALNECERALKISPYSFVALSEKATTLTFMGRLPEAIKAFQELLKVFPDNDEGWINLAICYFNNKESEKAVQAISKVSPGFRSAELESLNSLLNKK